MSPRRLLLLGLAALALGLAALLLPQRLDEQAAPPAAQPLLPQLAQRLAEVDEVQLRLDGGQILTIRREGDAWQVAERGGWPANVQQLARLLRALARVEGLEPKTANPELYSRLGVQDPQSGGEGRSLRVLAAGQEIAHVIVGTSGSGGNSYLRLAGEPQSWLGSEWLDVPQSLSNWLQTELISLEPATVVAVEVQRADAETYRIERQDEALRLLLAGEPQPARAGALERVTGALRDLSLQDLVNEPPPEGAWHRTRFELSGGHGVVALTRQNEDALYLRLRVERADGEDDLGARLGALAERAAGRTFVVAGFLGERLAPALSALREAPATDG